MTDSIKGLFDIFLHFISQAESFYVIESSLIFFGALLLDMFQRKTLKTFKSKAKRTKTILDDIFLEALSKPISIIIWILSVSYVAEIIQVATKQMLFYELFAPAREVGIVLCLVIFIMRLISKAEKNILIQSEVSDKTTVHALAKLGYIVVGIAGLLTLLQSLGLSISGLMAFGGMGGIAVGFAAQDLLANFFGGLFIYTDRPFSVGDWIRSPDRDIEGTVEKIGWRVTQIRTFDKRPLYIPNAIFSQIAVENPSRMTNRRIKETIGIRYDDAGKMAKIIELTKEMLLAHSDIDTSKTLIVNFNAFASSSLDFFIYTFTKTTNWVDYHQIKQDVLLKVLDIIEGQGAECAFPTSTVHMADGELFRNIDNES
jgi:MscS family membrane protein